MLLNVAVVCLFSLFYNLPHEHAIIFNLLFVYRHLHCTHILYIFVVLIVHQFLGRYLGIKLLGSRVCECMFVPENATLHFMSNVQVFPLIHVLPKYICLKFCKANRYKRESICLVFMICKCSLFWIVKSLSVMCITSIIYFVAYFFIFFDVFLKNTEFHISSQIYSFFWRREKSH